MKIKKYLPYALAIVVLVGGYFLWRSFKGPQEPVEVPEPPTIEKVLADTTNHLREAHSEEIAVWAKRVEDLTAINQKKDQDINRLKSRRKATNNNVDDGQLMASVSNTINQLKILGYE